MQSMLFFQCWDYIYKKPRIDNTDQMPDTPPPFEDNLDIYFVDDWDHNFDNGAVGMEGEEDADDEEDELLD